jgi:small subunit ribosomal protein S17
MADVNKARNIGLNVKPPIDSCNDKNCPFHGNLSVRGQVITGTVYATKMQNSIKVRKEYMHLVPKYERYEKRTSLFTAHCPSCIKLKIGDKVNIAECRPLSKTKSFVVIEKI